MTETKREVAPTTTARFTVRAQGDWWGIYALRALNKYDVQLKPVMITAFNCKKQATRYAELLNEGVSKFFAE